MGWISKRKMQEGRGIGGRRASRVYPKDGAPLRKVVAVLHNHLNMFQADPVLLECGHHGHSWGGQRARCPKCKEGLPPDETPTG
jgi:hypothetical protein